MGRFTKYMNERFGYLVEADVRTAFRWRTTRKNGRKILIRIARLERQILAYGRGMSLQYQNSDYEDVLCLQIQLTLTSKP